MLVSDQSQWTAGTRYQSMRDIVLLQAHLVCQIAFPGSAAETDRQHGTDHEFNVDMREIIFVNDLLEVVLSIQLQANSDEFVPIDR